MRLGRIRTTSKGNALIEYALPAGIFVVGVGILATTVDINGMIGGMFASANGGTVNGGKYVATSMGMTASGAQGNGSANFTPSGGGGGFGPGTSMGGGGGGGGGGGNWGDLPSSSGNNGPDAAGGQGQDEVLAALAKSKNPMDVYNAIKDSDMPEKFKSMVQGMAQIQMSMSNTTKDKVGNNNGENDGNLYKQRQSLDAVTLAMLQYAAVHGGEIEKYGGYSAAVAAQMFSSSSMAASWNAWLETNPEVLAAAAKTMGFNGINTADIVNGKLGTKDMAQLSLVMSMCDKGSGFSCDIKNIDKLIEAIKDGKSLDELQAIASGMDPAEAARLAKLGNGICESAESCLDNEKMQVVTIKGKLDAKQKTILDTAQKKKDEEEAAAAATPT